ncbi:MAG: AI-2E family transporter, partial [Deltaproteobacteria bacterium]|nr:AI-2E family transporter [Deltaproteobacteria bacterium]
KGILLLPRPEGGFEVLLPPEGIAIEPAQGGGFIIHSRALSPPPGSQLSLRLTEALRRQLLQGERSAGEAFRAAQAFLAAVVSGVFKFFIMLMLSAYMLITKDAILGFFRLLVVQEYRESFDRLLERIDRGLAGVVRGQLLICLVNGVLSGIGFYFIGLNYWPVLTLIAGALSIIPIFGAILSSIPAIVIALQQGLPTAVITLLWIIGIHQLEANLLNPKIMGDAAKVHPVLVVFSLIAGEHFFGIIGALLAVPVLSIAQSLFLHFREAALGVPARLSLTGLEKDLDAHPSIKEEGGEAPAAESLRS